MFVLMKRKDTAMALKIESSDKKFSVLGGLAALSELLKRTGLEKSLIADLPQTKRSWDKFEALALGFCAGAQCLEDMDELCEDPIFEHSVRGRLYESKTYGNYLRSFEQVDIHEINKKLTSFAFSLRNQKLVDPDEELVFDIDSTLCRQYAEKMEGVELGYQKFPCLHVLKVFDEFGFQYYHDVRKGNSHTSENISGVIHSLMSNLPPTIKRSKITARVDAGYCNQHFVNACFSKGISYVMGFRKGENFCSIASNVRDWQSSSLKFYDGRECEVGSTNYKMSGCAQRSRIVIIRAKKKVAEGYKGGLFDEEFEDYDYFAFATNISKSTMENEELIKFYRKRGNGENFIRE